MKSSLKNFIKERAKNCCEYCFAQERFSADMFSGEHIVPVSKGGTDDDLNLALACQRCNNLKYVSTHALDPATGGIVLLYNPRLDDWYSHFRWNETSTLILGLSPTGRATIKRLQLNRDGLVNLRQILTPLGLHPPF
jgi:HNH endonuclease